MASSILLPRSTVSRVQVKGIARALVRHLVSTRSTFRGARTQDDGRITLLTVDFDLTDDVLRLGRTFRRSVSSEWPMVAVQNGPRRNNAALRRAGWSVVGMGTNLHHGLALDWGLRKVETEYVLVCDPDTVIVNAAFIEELMPRLARFGVCGLVIGDRPDLQYYHPICTACRTEVWTQGKWSMGPDWSRGWDAGAALTEVLGGVEPDAVLPLTLPSEVAGVLWANSFSNIYGGSLVRDTDKAAMYGRPIEQVRAYHRRWRAWADEVAVGSAGADEFPTSIA
jgi:hypothetical protein